MRFADYLRIAFGNVRRQKMRSALTIAAIVIGATGITVMLTFVTSIKNYTIAQFAQAGQIRQIAVGPTPNLKYSQYGNQNGPGINSSSGGIVITSTLVKRIARIPHVTALTPTLNGNKHGPGFQWLAFGGKRLQVQQVEAYTPNGVIKPNVLAGRALESTDGTGVIMLTKEYADALGFKGRYEQLVGRRVIFHTQPNYTGFGAVLPDLSVARSCTPSPNKPCDGGNGFGNLRPVDLPARVVGVASNANSGPAIFMTLHWALLINDQARPENGRWVRPSVEDALDQKNPGCPTCAGYDSVILNVDTTANVKVVAAQIRKLGLGAGTAQAEIDLEVHAFNILSYVLGGIGLIALFIAALGVINTMVMAALERTREIGVMRAVGAKRSTVRRLFTVEASALGFLGGLIGVVIGDVALLIAQPIINRQLEVQHLESSLSLSVPVWLIFVVIAGTTLIGLASGLLPARRAARLDPVEALRYE